jgi:hypothetical protein
MEDNAQSSQSAPPASPPAPKAAKPVIRQPKVGDPVWLQTPPGRHHNAQPLPAEITAVLKATLVNLKTTEESEHEHTIVRSPFDPTGTKPDSWRFRD